MICSYIVKDEEEGREHKESVVNSIREAVECYNSVYVFSFENMRNLKFKEFKEQLKSSSRLLHMSTFCPGTSTVGYFWLRRKY